MVHFGYVSDVIKVSDKLHQIIIKQKNKFFNDRYDHVAFSVFGTALKECVYLNVEKGDLIKTKSYISSRKHNDKYYVSIVLYNIEIRQKSTKQLKANFNEKES